MVLGQQHRGRLNTITGLLQFPLTAMFSKVCVSPPFPCFHSHVSIFMLLFQIMGKSEHAEGAPSSGDVPSHLGKPPIDNAVAHFKQVSIIASQLSGSGDAWGAESPRQLAPQPLPPRGRCPYCHGQSTGSAALAEGRGLPLLPPWALQPPGSDGWTAQR